MFRCSVIYAKVNNKDHRLRRTSEEKREAVKNALEHPMGSGLSDRKIAEHVGVDHNTALRWRKELETTGDIPQSLGADSKKNGDL